MIASFKETRKQGNKETRKSYHIARDAYLPTDGTQTLGYRHVLGRYGFSEWSDNIEGVRRYRSVRRFEQNSKSFDYAPRDETARGSAQDDNALKYVDTP
jgi:hypothetical protein